MPAVQETVARVREIDVDQYKYGFVTDIEFGQGAQGPHEDTVRFISAKKDEPGWMLDWRLEAFRRWKTMDEPTWANVRYPKIDFQDLYYYSAPKGTEGPRASPMSTGTASTYAKLGIPLKEQEVLAGVQGRRTNGSRVAVDAVFDSVSVVTTFKEELARAGVIFCSMSEAVQNHPELVRKYLGSVVPSTDNFYLAGRGVVGGLAQGGPRVVQGVIPFEPKDVAAISEEVRARYAKSVMSEVITSTPGSVKGSTKPIKLDVLAARLHSGVQAPLPRFAELGSHYGHFGADPDSDGTIRRSPILVKLKEPAGLFPSLGLRVAATQLEANIVPFIEDDELMGVELVGPKGRVLVLLQTDAGMLTTIRQLDSFTRLSVVDGADMVRSKPKVAGKAVVAGVTITGSTGDHDVPFNEMESGVITHASMISNILD